MLRLFPRDEDFVKAYADGTGGCNGNCGKCILGCFELDNSAQCQDIAKAVLEAVKLYNKENPGA